MGVADVGEPHFFIESEGIPLGDQLCSPVIVQNGFYKPPPYSTHTDIGSDLQAPYLGKCGVIAGLNHGNAQHSVIFLHDIRRTTAEMVTAVHSFQQRELFMTYQVLHVRRKFDFF